ncbi:hypothetical protein H109_05661 [Trichophyton interdigitale MR816]|uniref:Uncharacterized protein n=1 Tax=Trichophyton interdigitale (strain MR816) TaxID=1215338 RepID=A0A059J3Z3_TRIIM|nr:hypothetical protein H109_05661 [Trichophyton interdigitale MR816]
MHLFAWTPRQGLEAEFTLDNHIGILHPQYPAGFRATNAGIPSPRGKDVEWDLHGADPKLIRVLLPSKQGKHMREPALHLKAVQPFPPESHAGSASLGLHLCRLLERGMTMSLNTFFVWDAMADPPASPAWAVEPVRAQDGGQGNRRDDGRFWLSGFSLLDRPTVSTGTRISVQSDGILRFPPCFPSVSVDSLNSVGESQQA